MDFAFDGATRPTLTMTPFAQSPQDGAAVPGEVAEAAQLTPEERRMVDDFAAQIDLSNSTAILQYGAGAQKKMSDFSEQALERVQTRELGEVGELLAKMVTEIREFDTEDGKGFFGLFSRGKNKIAALKTRYNKVEANVETICRGLEGHQVQLLKDIAVLDKMYEANLAYFKELSMYILAGKKKLEQVRGQNLPAMLQKAQASNLPEDVQAVKDLESQCDRFEKKLHDLDLTRNVSIQTAPQIRLIQGNNTMMVEKIQSTLVNTIPLWKSQMVLALGVAHSKDAVQAQRAVTDLTNELLRRNADTLKTATVDIARETERGIVDMETLRHTNQTLLASLDEVVKIQQEGRQQRAAAEVELRKMEDELKAKLLETVSAR